MDSLKVARRRLGVTALATALVLTGCSTTKPPATSWCDLNQPIRPTEASLAAMSDDEVAEALSHNTYGVRACKWKP